MNRESIRMDRIARRLILPASVLAMVCMLAATWMIFFYAVPERTMGIVQLIMYLHVPAAFVTYLAYTVLFLSSCALLWGGRIGWDRMAQSAGEIGMGFASIMIITGPLWAKPVWGHFWTWDPRLTSAFVLWLIYGVYLLLRLVVDRPDKRAKFCAVLAILGMADLPIVHYSVKWWNATHPSPVIMQEKVGGGLGDPSMKYTLLVAFIAQVLLFVVLLLLRHNQLRLTAEINSLEHQKERERLLAGSQTIQV